MWIAKTCSLNGDDSITFDGNPGYVRTYRRSLDFGFQPHTQTRSRDEI